MGSRDRIGAAGARPRAKLKITQAPLPPEKWKPRIFYDYKKFNLFLASVAVNYRLWTGLGSRRGNFRGR